jgi:hypothetical protein
MIDDDENEDSPTDDPDLKMSDRNEEVTRVSESIGGSYPDQETPVSSVGTGDCSTEEISFKELVKGGYEGGT